ncbi:RusA family crossover junction endodeoxyribonuclease [Lactobacillus sp. S2-2]|nr:RusA family crossover junction endodeoxyribonuclease [Lactobacillus sp. S2-2]
MTNQSISFTYFGKVVPQGRPRFNKNGFAYDPVNSRNFKSSVKYQAMAEYKGKPLSENPLKVELVIYRKVQQSESKKRTELKQMNCILPTKKPDTDNYYKSISDALTGVFWQDDNQITDIAIKKRFADSKGERFEIYVTEIDKERD